MIEIPADVMQAAERVAECLNPGTVPHALVMDAAVRAILTERERAEREVLAHIRDRLVEKRGDPRAYGQGFYDPLGPQIAVLDALLRD